MVLNNRACMTWHSLQFVFIYMFYGQVNLNIFYVYHLMNVIITGYKESITLYFTVVSESNGL